MLYNSFRQFVEGIANPSISMWVLLTGNLLNIIGNYILIYGKYGMPELGLLGAGISTFISRIIMLLLFIAVFMLRTDYKPYRKGFTHIRINKQSWRRLNSIGWPISLQPVSYTHLDVYKRQEYYFSKKLKEVAEMNAAGKNVINLGVGSPDLPPSEQTIETLCEHARKANEHGYQPYVGIPELRKGCLLYTSRCV